MKKVFKWSFMLWLWMMATIAVAMYKSNNYEVVGKDTDVILVNRKGELIMFYDTGDYQVGDSIKISMDFDWCYADYNPLIIK